ncbi:MAG: hypothetical protein NC821_06310, partial [Candidatus Omnitrophica bacterium]|nr:hypothetical protein [Candidatus Omnitrophota bacterium]
MNDRDKTRTPFQIALQRLKKHRLAMLGFWILVVFYSLAIFADFFAPYNFDNEKREDAYHPPTAIHFGKREGKVCFYIYRYEQRFDEFYRRIYYAERSRIYPLKFFTRGDSYKLLGIFRTKIH